VLPRLNCVCVCVCTAAVAAAVLSIARIPQFYSLQDGGDDNNKNNKRANREISYFFISKSC